MQTLHSNNPRDHWQSQGIAQCKCGTAKVSRILCPTSAHHHSEVAKVLHRHNSSAAKHACNQHTEWGKWAATKRASWGAGPIFQYPEVAQRRVKHNAEIELRQSLGLTSGTLRSQRRVEHNANTELRPSPSPNLLDYLLPVELLSCDLFVPLAQLIRFGVANGALILCCVCPSRSIDEIRCCKLNSDPLI